MFSSIHLRFILIFDQNIICLFTIVEACVLLCTPAGTSNHKLDNDYPFPTTNKSSFSFLWRQPFYVLSIMFTLNFSSSQFQLYVGPGCKINKIIFWRSCSRWTLVLILSCQHHILDSRCDLVRCLFLIVYQLNSASCLKSNEEEEKTGPYVFLLGTVGKKMIYCLPCSHLLFKPIEFQSFFPNLNAQTSNVKSSCWVCLHIIFYGVIFS